MPQKHTYIHKPNEHNNKAERTDLRFYHLVIDKMRKENSDVPMDRERELKIYYACATN